MLAAILLAAAAVLLVALRPWFDKTEYASVVAEPAEIAPMPEPAPLIAVEASVPVDVAPVVAALSLEPIRVVVLAGHSELDPVRQATLHALRTMPGVEVLDVYPTHTAFYEADIIAEITRGGGLVSMELRRPDGAGNIGGTIYTANGTSYSDVKDSLGLRFAETIVRVGAPPASPGMR
jgi:hypothetical protein